MSKQKYFKTVFDWDHFRVYLSGAIDFARDMAKPWREQWTRDLVDMGFKPNQILDPCNKPLPDGLFDLDNEGEIMAGLREAGDYEGLCDVMADIGHIDLRLVDKSDLMLVNFTKHSQKEIQSITDLFSSSYDRVMHRIRENNINDAEMVSSLGEMARAYLDLQLRYTNMRVATFGTIHEVVSATERHIPTFVVWEGGKQDCSAWIMWLVGHQNIFDNFEHLKAYLKDISQGKQAYKAKDWLLFDFGKNSV